MRLSLLLLCATILTGCNPPDKQSETIDSSSFVGNWLGIRPEGVTTFHSDSSFRANGEIEVRFFSCLSSHIESQWTDRGEWSWADNVLTITLVTDTEVEGETETYIREYTLLDENWTDEFLVTILTTTNFGYNVAGVTSRTPALQQRLT